MIEISETQNVEELIAPKIIGNAFSKKILCLQMFSNPAQNEKMHLLLVGEVASGKSMLGDDISHMVPHSCFASRKITPVGLIENVTMCNGGIYVQDELDKVEKNTREMLLEVMQFGRVTSDKFQSHSQIEAKCNIVALCNPRGNILNKGVGIVDQLPFGLALMSRFHLVVPFYSVDSDLYGEIARGYIVHEDSTQRRRQVKEYLIQVKSKLPKIEVPEDLALRSGNYVKMLKDMSIEKAMITPRLIEGTISMVRASARMNLRQRATEKDFKYVAEILKQVYL